MKKKIKVLLLAILVCGVIFAEAFAGSLEPSGPPGPTMKTLSEVEPRIPIPAGTGMATYFISTSGSYYLAGNRTSIANAIYISTSHVTVDLMGYTLTGPGSGTNYGILINTDCNNVEIRNGIIRDYGQHGIYSSATSCYDIRIIDIRAIGNLQRGISLLGYGNKVENCTASANGYYGIYVGGGSGSGSVISGCIARDNGSSGILADTGSVVTNCASIYNNSYGIYASIGCTITNNTATSNTFYGIYASGASVVTGNTAAFNGSGGIYSSSGGLVKDNSAYSNTGSGFYAASGCAVTNNTARDNTTNGFTILTGCTVVGNNAYSNDSYGFNIGSNCLVDQNAAYGNVTANMNALPASCIVPSGNLAP